MKVYFLSAEPCALTLNELYFGITDTFERSLDVTLSDRIYAKFSPSGKLPIGFFITEEILSTPPTGCEVYLLKDGVAIFAKDFPCADFTLRPITQARIDDTLVTVFSQGGIQVSIESPQGFFISSLPPSFSTCELSSHAGLLFLKSETQLAVFTKGGELSLLETVYDYFVENGELRATLPLSDRLQRTAECVWSLTEHGCARVQYIIKQAVMENEATLKDELLPYAFFESVLIGANFEELLTDELLPTAEKLVQFLGEFIAVTLTENPCVCGLIRKNAPNLFQVNYYEVEMENGKVKDVRPV